MLMLSIPDLQLALCKKLIVGVYWLVATSLNTYHIQHARIWGQFKRDVNETSDFII